MIFPQEDYLEWAKKYGLRIQEGECLKCGMKIITDIPFALGGYRGLKSKDHGCGQKYTWKTMKPVSEEEKKFWSELTKDMK